MAAMVLGTGLSIETNLVTGLGGTPPRWHGWGTSGATTTKGMTGLQAASPEARVYGTMAMSSQGVYANDTFTTISDISSGITQTIQELALFDALTAGNAYFRADFASNAFAVNRNDTVHFTVIIIRQ